MLFPKGKNYSRGIGDALRSSKTKVGSYHLKKTPWNTEWLPFRTHSHREFSGRKCRECGGNRGKYKTYFRKEPVMKMMVEHHFAGNFNGRINVIFFNHLKFIWNYVKTELVQGLLEGLHYNSHIQTCTSVDALFRKIIQQNVFINNISEPGWYPCVFFEGMEYPRCTGEGDHVG